MLGSAVSSSTPKDFQPNSHKGVVSRTEVMQRRSSDSSLVDALRHGQLNDDEAEALLDLVTDEQCPASGSSLFGRTGDEIEVHVGCLDAADQLRPTYESWVIRREDWLPPFDVARHYQRDREGKGRSEP